MAEERTLRVERLTRVEGEGALHVRIADGRVEQVRLSIFEPPRFFEALLRGRPYTDAPDVTARICGICPVAYQVTASAALEAAAGVRVEGPLRDLRRLLYCGEWIASHALHVYLLHAPDFLGARDVVELARGHREAVERGLRLKHAGNAILALLGGREIHPVNVRVGGFHRLPDAPALAELARTLEVALDDALATVAWVAGFHFPAAEVDHEFVALRHPDEYPIDAGRIASSGGLDVDADGFAAELEERQVPHSTALHRRLRGRGPYLVGPLARYALNSERLSPRAARAARDAGLGAVCRNPFRSIVVRAVELVYACEEALAILARRARSDLEGDTGRPDRAPLPDRALPPYVAVDPRGATGAAATEAPRGLLHHTYRVDAAGELLWARIVPPTAQNQGALEAELRAHVAAHLTDSDAALREGCERTIRNHDPCISCATHFLDLRVERR